MDSKDELEALLQKSILDVYKELQIIFMDNENVTEIFKDIDDLISKISKLKTLAKKMELYETVINLLCLIYSQNKAVVNKIKHSLYEIDVYKLKIIKLKIDQVLHYEEKDKLKPITTNEFIKKSKELFDIGKVTDFDYTLLISNGIVKREANQNIVEFRIKNTRCLEYDIKGLIDNKYVSDNFNYTHKHGISKKMIERYKTITIYDNDYDEIKSTPVLDVKDVEKSDKLYQAIDKEHVRELVPIGFYQLDNKSKHQLTEYNDINLIEQLVTHIESFEISLLRSNEYTKIKRQIHNFSGKAGVIDNYLKNNSIEDSLWKTLAPMKTSEDSSLRLASSIYLYTYNVLKNHANKRFIHDKTYINKLNDIRM